MNKKQMHATFSLIHLCNDAFLFISLLDTPFSYTTMRQKKTSAIAEDTKFHNMPLEHANMLFICIQGATIYK